MIELFDASRLLPRRDRSLAIAGGVLGLGMLGLGVHAFLLDRELQVLKADAQYHQAELARLKGAAPPPAPTLLADLEQLARRLEAEVAAANGGGAGQSPSASQWMERLDTLASAEIGLSLVEIDRSGSARIEGVAKSPQAMSSYVQAWERHGQAQGQTQEHGAPGALAPMRARAIEVRQDEKFAPLLRFQMRANLPGLAP